MNISELRYEYESFWKILCRDYSEFDLCIAFVDVHVPYKSLLNHYCVDVYNAEMTEEVEVPMMPYDVKRLEEIGKYITFVQNKYYNSKDGKEITYLIEVFSYIQETMELPDGFLDYYDKVQAEEMLKG